MNMFENYIKLAQGDPPPGLHGGHVYHKLWDHPCYLHTLGRHSEWFLAHRYIRDKKLKPAQFSVPEYTDDKLSVSLLVGTVHLYTYIYV